MGRGHVHNILGGSNFALSTTFEDLRASECTSYVVSSLLHTFLSSSGSPYCAHSCLVKQDMSNYWTPQVRLHFSSFSFREEEEELIFCVRCRRLLQLYFQWKNGSFSSVDTTGGGLIYYRASWTFSSLPFLPLILTHFLSSRL
jgi:hypothetical protein